jgi:hypothetical protein
MVVKHLRAPSTSFSILDPCAGAGAAMEQLGQSLGCPQTNLYAVELDEARGAMIRQRLPDANVLSPASIFGVACSLASFSLAWVNPPFDNELGGGRVETSFLNRVTPWIRPGGILAFVCPENVADRYDVRHDLSQWYESVLTLAIPESVRKYREVVVLGVRRKTIGTYGSTHRCEDQNHVFDIPAGDNPVRFQKVELTDQELAKALASSPLRRHLTLVPPQALPRPPLALGVGHIALLLASGHLDGVVSGDGIAHAVRGTARKEKYLSSVMTTESADGKSSKTVEVYSERIQLIVKAVGQQGAIRSFGDTPTETQEAQKGGAHERQR